MAFVIDCVTRVMAVEWWLVNNTRVLKLIPLNWIPKEDAGNALVSSPFTTDILFIILYYYRHRGPLRLSEHYKHEIIEEYTG